jgi:hypothetical protein
MSKDQPGHVPAQNSDGEEAKKLAASPRAEIDAFLNQLKSLDPAANAAGRGRLLFALDATMSRQPTWDQACVLQAEMFREAAAAGGLDIQLVYYRGLSECRASAWIGEARQLGELMSHIDCRGGHTQIAKVLSHARRESEKALLGALIFVGDGAYCRFAPGAADELGELLRAAAAYAAGGMKALADLRAKHSAGASKLIEQLK